MTRSDIHRPSTRIVALALLLVGTACVVSGCGGSGGDGLRTADIQLSGKACPVRSDVSKALESAGLDGLATSTKEDAATYTSAKRSNSGSILRLGGGGDLECRFVTSGHADVTVGVLRFDRTKVKRTPDTPTGKLVAWGGLLPAAGQAGRQDGAALQKLATALGKASPPHAERVGKSTAALALVRADGDGASAAVLLHVEGTGVSGAKVTTAAGDLAERLGGS